MGQIGLGFSRVKIGLLQTRCNVRTLEDARQGTSPQRLVKRVCQEWCQHLDVVFEQGSWHWIRHTMLIWQLTYGHYDVVVGQ